MRFLGIDHGARRIGLSYGDELGVATPLPALTEAESTIAKSKRREVRASGIIDSRAATIILQDYLDLLLPPPGPCEEETP